MFHSDKRIGLQSSPQTRAPPGNARQRHPCSRQWWCEKTKTIPQRAHLRYIPTAPTGASKRTQFKLVFLNGHGFYDTPDVRSIFGILASPSLTSFSRSARPSRSTRVFKIATSGADAASQVHYPRVIEYLRMVCTPSEPRRRPPLTMIEFGDLLTTQQKPSSLSRQLHRRTRTFPPRIRWGSCKPTGL